MNTWTIMTYELRRLFRSRSLLINQFLLPLVLIFILGTSLSGMVGDQGGQTIHPVRVGVVNQPSKNLAESSLVDSFLKTPELHDVIIPAAVPSREAAESGLRTGKYGYAVIVPPDFDLKVERGEQARLEFILGKDHTDNLVAGTVFDNFVNRVNDMQATALILGPDSLAAYPASGSDTQPVIKMSKLGADNGSYSASQFYAASMLLMFLLYCGLTVNVSLFNEKEQNTLYRLGSMPVKGAQLFIGKMLGVGAVAIVQCLAIIGLSHWLFGVYWGNRPAMLLLFCLLMIIASMTLSIVVSMFFKSGASARSVITLLTVCMTFLSGGMSPLPDSWVNSVGKFTINHWAMQSILRMMLQENISKILPNLLVMSLICFVLFGAALLSYRKVGYHA